jgi:predicted heme/steroid binding protein
VSDPVDTEARSVKELRDVSMAELQKHNTPEDCWIAIAGTVYDFTAFAEEHPAGAQSIHDLAGKDGTAAFQAVHNIGILEDSWYDDNVELAYSQTHPETLFVEINKVAKICRLRNNTQACDYFAPCKKIFMEYVQKIFMEYGQIPLGMREREKIVSMAGRPSTHIADTFPRTVG